MRGFLFLMVSVLLAGGGLAAGEGLRIADFEKTAGGFSGAAALDQPGAASSASCLKIENAGAKWVTAQRDFAGLEQDFASLSFLAKSAGPQALAVRLTDATGQNFQQRLPLKADGEWREVKITDFVKGEIFDGAGDQKWHGPARSLSFILESPGTVWIDNLQAELTGVVLPEIAARKAKLAKAPKLVVATFEKGADGFGGNVPLNKESAKQGKAYLTLTKPTMEKWVSTAKKFEELQNDFLEFSFWARTKEATLLAVRFTDATGQEFQQRLELIPDGKWNRVVVEEFGKGQSWGGANDKVWHGPAKAVTFTLEQNGGVDIDDVQARLDDRKLVSLLEWKQAQPGNVFLSGEEVRLPLQTSGDEVEYVVSDFGGKEVARGAVKTEAEGAALVPPAGNGYYLVKATVRKGGQPVKEGYTSYVVVPPYEVKDRATAPWGVMTHFAQGMNPERLLPIIRKLGIVAIRDEHYWGQVEAKKGAYSFPAYSEPYMSEAKKDGIDPLIALTFANKNYDNGQTPNSDEAVAAYGNYAQAVMEKFGPQIRWLEVWNEYNGTWCNGPAAKDRSKSYAKLVKGAYEKIKAKNPQVKVLGCACVLIPLPYIEGIFKNGGLNYMDGVVIHPYRGRPEGVDAEVEELQELIRKYNGGKDKEIWVTETGSHNTLEYDWEAGKKLYERGRHEVASYLARQYVLLLKSGCVKIFWYLVSDHQSFVSMGLLRNADEPSGAGSNAAAPAAAAYATVIRQLDGTKYVRREGFRKYTRARCYLFQAADGGEVRTLWATAPAKMTLSAAGPLEAVDLVGAVRTLTPENGKVTLELSEEIIYVRGKAEKVEEVDTGVRYLASAVDDYSKTQGKDGWFYGLRHGAGGEFEEMTQAETMWGVTWGSEKEKYLKQSDGGGHPAGGGKNPVYVDRRWVSPAEGAAMIRGKVGVSSDKSDGIEFVVLANGKELYRKAVVFKKGESGEAFAVPVELQPGMKIDFLFGPNGHTNFDSFNFDINIVQEAAGAPGQVQK